LKNFSYKRITVGNYIFKTKVGTESNLVDIVWGTDQPARPENPVFPLEIEFAGKTWDEKVNEMREQVCKAKEL